ncbi:Rab family GTPase [Tumidithrix elongata RA019]|uniref:Rab family GTPase n=1 Tax=Tumidithrix elongata BACA0141 TaxID=2716417 RepID=A0AAW9PTF1_9CYAN|nr:Rab family GTPase [Tumidithrix elongata RA019]
MSTISKKMCMIGDFGVGKTSLICRFVDRSFSDQYLSTVGVKISRKMLELSNPNQQDQLNLQVLIWDIEGSTKFKAIAPSYLQGSKGALIVADVTRPETLSNLSQHIKLFLSVNPKGYAIVALNKADLVEPEKLAKLLEIYQFPEQNRVLGVQATSAKLGDGVDQIFHKLAHSMVQPE